MKRTISLVLAVAFICCVFTCHSVYAVGDVEREEKAEMVFLP